VSRTPGRRSWEIPHDQCVVIGKNIRALRQSRGWTQQTLGELMGWPTASTVCAAEGHRGDRQRGFTADEVVRLATIFDVTVWRLMRQCQNCGGRPPTGFACLACGAALTPRRNVMTSDCIGHRHEAEITALPDGIGGFR